MLNRLNKFTQHLQLIAMPATATVTLKSVLHRGP